MYKLQQINKSGWLDVKYIRTNKIIRFPTKDDAIAYRMKFFGISAKNYIRIVRTERKNKNLKDYF